MNQIELQAQYESVQNNIRQQFEEIELLTNQEGDNKDIIIEKLVIQNQYIYNQYVKLYEKSLTIDDIAHLIDLSSRDELEIKQYVQDQVKNVFEEKKMLEQQLGSLNMEVYKLKEKCLQFDQINDKNIYKKQLDELLNAYSDYRSHSLNQYLAMKEINSANFKSTIMKDLEVLSNLIGEQKGQHYATFQGLQFENEIQTHSIQNSQQQFIQKIARSESTRSQEKFVKEPLSKKSSTIMIDNNYEKNLNISAMLRANKIEIENELRKLQKFQSQEQHEEQLESDLAIERSYQEIERIKKEEVGLKTIIKHSVQRLSALIDEISSQNLNSQSLIDSLRDELTDITSRVYTMKKFSQDEETEKWNKVVKSVQLSYEEQINQSRTDTEQKDKDIQKLREFIQEYETQVDNMKRFIEDIENSVKDKEDLIVQMNKKVESVQFQLEDEQNFYQQQIEEKNEQVIKLTSQLQSMTNQKNELLTQNSSFKDEVTKIEEQLNQMIISKRDYEDGLDKEKEETYIQYNKLRVEYEVEAEKFLNQIQEYENQIDIHKKQLNLKEIEMDEMQNTFNQLEAFSKRQLVVIQEQQEQIMRQRKAKEKNREYKQMIQSSNEDIQNLKADFNKLINQTQSIQQELEMKNEEKAKLKEEISFLKMRNEGYEKRIDVIERRNDELEDLVLQKEKQVNPDQNYFSNKLHQLEQEKIQLVQENSTLIEQKKELTNKTRVLMQSIEQLQDQNEKSVDINTQLANERDLLQDKLFKLSDLITLNREKLQKQEQNILQYQQIIESYRSSSQSQSQRQHTFKDTENELSTNSIFNNINQFNQYQPQQIQQRSITLSKDSRNDIVVQQEYQPNQPIYVQRNPQQFDNNQGIQFTQSNSNSKYQKISTFSQPFYQESENYIQSSNFSNGQSENNQQYPYPQSDHIPKYSFSNPNSNPQHTPNQALKEEIQEEPASNEQTKRANHDDYLQHNNLTYSKSNLSYSPFTVQNEGLNSDDTFNNSNINQTRIPTDNQNQIKTDRYNNNNNNQNPQNNFQQQQQQQQSSQQVQYQQQQKQQINPQSPTIPINQLYRHESNSTENGKALSSRHKQSLDEDLKKLNSLTQAIFDKKSINQQ